MWVIIGWIVWIGMAVLSISWAYGCRVYTTRGIGFQWATGVQTFFWWAITIIFLILPFNKLHILWVAPLAFWMARIIVCVEIPILTPTVLFLTNIFLRLILIGENNSNKQTEMTPTAEYVNDYYLENKPKIDKWNAEMKKSPNANSAIRILAVDDEPSVVESFRMILMIKDYYVQCALQAKDALEILEKEKFDIIFSGLKMPVMSGIDFLKIAKHKYPDTEFIMVTAYDDKETRALALSLGALEYLRKPFKMEEIYDLVEKGIKLCHIQKGGGQL